MYYINIKYHTCRKTWSCMAHFNNLEISFSTCSAILKKIPSKIQSLIFHLHKFENKNCQTLILVQIIVRVFLYFLWQGSFAHNLKTHIANYTFIDNYKDVHVFKFLPFKRLYVPVIYKKNPKLWKNRLQFRPRRTILFFLCLTDCYFN